MPIMLFFILYNHLEGYGQVQQVNSRISYFIETIVQKDQFSETFADRSYVQKGKTMINMAVVIRIQLELKFHIFRQYRGT